MSTRYQMVNAASSEANEDNDCVVVALAIAADMSYKRAHHICARNGRRRRCGMSISRWLPMFKRRVRLKESKYLGGFGTAVTLSRALAGRPGVYLVWFTSHLSVWSGDEWHDWMTDDRRKRVKRVWEVTPK